MVFKVIVLFCALNFFTATRGFGLGLRHINGLIDLSENYYVNNEKIDKYFIKEDITNSEQINKLRKDLDADTTMSEFLISLAYFNKGSFSFAENSLSTYEVKLFVRMFVAQDKKGKRDGFLDRVELEELIENGFKLNQNIKELIISEFKDNQPIHVLSYLAAILKNKPTGRGLDEAQITKCHILCWSHDEFLHTGDQQELFKTLNIVSEDYVADLLDIQHVHVAAHELKEILVFWSEYNVEDVHDDHHDHPHDHHHDHQHDHDHDHDHKHHKHHKHHDHKHHGHKHHDHKHHDHKHHDHKHHDHKHHDHKHHDCQHQHHHQAPLLTTKEVRDAMDQLTKYDQDKDGLLNFQEFSNFANEQYPKPEAEALIKTFNPQRSRLMCAAMFLNMKLSNEIPRQTLEKLWADEK